MSAESNKPKETVFRITDIEYSNSQIDDKIVGIFRFESSGAKKRGPTLLVLTEIESVGYVYDQLIDVVNNEAEHSRNLVSNVEQDPVTRFEKIIQNINRSVKDFLEEESTPINWNRVNMFVLELSEGHLCLAGIGRLMNMFLQKQPDGSYRTFDLFGSLDQSVDLNKEKVFSNIICGDFRCDDLLIAGSNNFERIRNELRLKERLTTLPPVTATLEIKQELESRGTPDDFVATVVACTAADKPAPTLPAATGEDAPDRSTASIQELRNTEASTTRTLAPTIAPKEQQTQTGEPNAPRLKKSRFGFLTKIVRLVKRERVKDVANMVNLRGMHAGFGSFFTKRFKLIITASVILVLLVVVGYFYQQQRKRTAAEEAAWNSSYDEIQSMINKAEGDAVYSEDRARKGLATALEKLDTLDRSTEERAEAIASLEDQASDIRIKLQRLVTVNRPTEVYTLQDGIADGALISPILFEGNLVAADQANEELVVVDLETNDISKVPLPDGLNRVAGIAAGRTSVIILAENRDLYAADLDSKAVSELTLGSADGSGTSDVVTYANRLYVLDATAEQIWRHPSISGGFGAATAYLQASSASLNDAVSLAIDSNVYVLKGDGTVVRYYGGGQDGFTLTPIDPPLTNGNQIWAEADQNYIVIADQAGKRIVVFTKEGKLVAQYQSQAFVGPTDVTVDPETKKVYVVDGNKVYQLLLP
ncbi:hypothetical protein GF380_01470 [Candidatus Uhrbacteria bacterium]|nr:hypothetical protein [Candidatus Uhrbacteria bacterium]MBD3283949.1 hypothetical protein [Candidatus Uhrbacteria bacterium]